MKKLEIELYRYENLVFGKILNQDESLRYYAIIVEKNDFKIESRSCPALQEAKLFIRGENKGADNNIFYYKFCDEETAITACKKIKECIDLINLESEIPGLERIL